MLLYLSYLLVFLVVHVYSNSNLTNAYDSRVWDIVIATCNKSGAGTDASTFMKIFYESGHDYETFHLDNPGRDDFERGSRDHFKLLFKQADIVNVGLFWWPGFSLSQSWCVDWLLLLNSDTETCYEVIFDKWILHYRDPPTYATKFHRLRFADCVAPGPESAERRAYLRSVDAKAMFRKVDSPVDATPGALEAAPGQALSRNPWTIVNCFWINIMQKPS